MKQKLLKTKKRLTKLALLLCLTFVSVSATQAQEKESYDLSIAGTTVTSSNCEDLTVLPDVSILPGETGAVYYDHSKRTLYLENSKIWATYNTRAIWSDIEDLKIEVRGENIIRNGSDEKAALRLKKNTQIIGRSGLNSKLTITSNKFHGIYFDNSLEISSCDIEITADNWGIKGRGGNTLTLFFAKITSLGEKDPSIGNIAGLELKGCSITSPVGAHFDATKKGVVDGSGTLIENQEIKTTIYSVSNKYVSFNVVSGHEIFIGYHGLDSDIPLKIVAGSDVYYRLIESAYGPHGFRFIPQSSTVKLYGDIAGFNLGNQDNENYITSVDASHNKDLERLDLDDLNSLQSLNVNGCSKLEYLWCYSNQLTSLDLSSCTKLYELNCGDNHLTSLNVSGFTDLKKLYCDKNELTSLDLSSCSSLDILECNDNQLIKLDVANGNNSNGNFYYKHLSAENNASGCCIHHDPDFEPGQHWTKDDDAYWSPIPCVFASGVTLEETSLQVPKGGTVQFTAIVSPANASNKNVSWESYNTSVATIDDDGLVTAVGVGAANIKATTEDGGFTVIGTVTVTMPVESVSISPQNVTMDISTAQQLTATVNPTNATNQDVSWESDNTNVATVNSNGLVTAVGAGTAYITVTTEDGGEMATCEVTVLQPVFGVSLTPETVTLNTNETQQLTATVYPDNASNQNVNWQSDNTDIATVDDNGLVTAVGVGTVDITVTTEDGGEMATCEVTVTDPSGVSAISAAAGISIYPNPVDEVLYIDILENKFSVELYNNYGQQVLQTQDKREISVSDLPNGIYMLKITTKQGVYSHKIVKK